MFTATWNDVGYYSAHVDKLDAFQLRLIDESGGNFDIEFRYQAINWTTGDASGGSGGLSGTPARAGFSAGDGIHVYELPQSGNQNALLGLPSNPAPPATQGVTGEPGIYRFQVRNGVIVPSAPTINGLVQDSNGSLPIGTHTTDTRLRQSPAPASAVTRSPFWPMAPRSARGQYSRTGPGELS